MPSHADLVKFAARWLQGTRRCSLVAAERTSSRSLESPDAIGWDAWGNSILVECKVSVADFRADQKKPHRMGAGMGLERWYLTPDGLLRDQMMPEGWGLAEVRGGKVYRVVQAKRRGLPEEVGQIARLEAPLLIALAWRSLYGAVGITLGEIDLEAA